MCGTLLSDVVAPDMHQNDCSYIRELSRPTFDYLCKNLAWYAVTRRTFEKTTPNCQNYEVGNCPGQYGILTHTQKYTQKNKLIYVAIHTCTHTCTDTQKHTHTHTHSYTYSKIHTQTPKHTHTHTHTHTCTYTPSQIKW